MRLAGAMLVAAVAVVGCASGPTDGGAEAHDRAEGAAKRLNDDLGRRSRVRAAEYIAATEIPTEPQDGGHLLVTPLAWSGQTSGDEQATIDVRFVVTLPEQEVVSFGGRGRTAGGATRCYRFTLQLYRDTGFREIPCPAVATPPVPSPSPPLTLPPDTEDRLAAALRTATPETLASVVRAAFPQQGFVVDTVTNQGALVAAVSVPAERDCVVMVRTPGGEPKRVVFDQIQLEPGETGCGTGLYTNPVR